MSLRRKFALALVGGVAVSTFQVQPASASSVCWVEYKKLTGDCNPCYTVAPIYYKVTGDYMFCVA